MNRLCSDITSMQLTLDIALDHVLEGMRTNTPDYPREIGKLVVDYMRYVPNRTRNQACRDLIYRIDSHPKEGTTP